MSNYTPITDFSVKDALSTGNPSKLILGSEVDAEFAAIQTAITSKIDDASSLSAETSIADTDVIPFYDDTANSHKKITFANLNSTVKDLKYIGTYTAVAATSLDIETGINSTLYTGYLLLVTYLYPATNATTLKMRIKRSGAYQSTSYSTMLGYYTSSAANTFNNTAAVADCWEVCLSASNTAASAFSGVISLTNPHSATSYLVAEGRGTWQGSGGNTNIALINGYYGSGGGLEGIRFLSSSGNITGSVKLYGYKV